MLQSMAPRHSTSINESMSYQSIIDPQSKVHVDVTDVPFHKFSVVSVVSSYLIHRIILQLTFVWCGKTWLLRGNVFVHVTRSDPAKSAEQKATSSLATLLLDFADGEDGVSEACRLLHSVKATLHSCQGLERVPPFFREGKLACERSELLADQFAKEHLLALLRSGGAKSALDFVQTQKIQPSPGLQMSIDVLKQGQLLEELTALVENYEPTAQDDKDFSRITQAIKSMLTVSSLSIEDVKHFYPDVPEKIQKFQAFVEKDMTQLFQSAMACIKKGSTLVEKYRLGQEQEKRAVKFCVYICRGIQLQTISQFPKLTSWMTLHRLKWTKTGTH